jgi:hypothetical protein
MPKDTLITLNSPKTIDSNELANKSTKPLRFALRTSHFSKGSRGVIAVQHCAGIAYLIIFN